MSTDSTLSARALASRRNGARSRGPRTAAGKAQSARNALKHGLCAKKLLIVPEEDAAAFEALQAQLRAELAPVGALQAVLAQRIVSAAWRLLRADRLEAEVLAFRRDPGGDLGVALIRDGNGTRGFETVLRYRNAAIAEFLRAHKALQALQAEAKTAAGPDLPAAPSRRPAGTPATRRARPRVARPVEPGKRRESDAPAVGAAIAARPDAPARKAEPVAPMSAATSTPARAGCAQRRLDVRAPGRSHHAVAGDDRSFRAPAAETKRTRENAPDQSVEPRTRRPSAA